jgi:hypothetical protein
MLIGKYNPRTVVLVVFIVIIGSLRTYLSVDQNMYGLSNFSPVGAMAIFGGIYFNKDWKAFLFPLVTLFISDVVLQYTIFYKPGNAILYGGWYWVYAAFVLMVAVSRFIKKVSIKSILLTSVIIVLVHWLVTDFGVWYESKTYSQDLEGYLQCLVMAVPFEGRFLAATLIYSTILFGAFEWLQYKYPVLVRSNQTIAS